MHKNALFFIEQLQKSPSARDSGLRPPCLRRQNPANLPPSLRNPGYVTALR